MRESRLPRVALAAVLALLLGPVPAHAGVCRSELRPLLLQAQPAAASIAAVRAHCEAEASAGDADATYQLALFHLGLGGEWNPAAAIPLIRSAAERDIAEK
ncbi:MAG: hypothetical protein FJ170_07775, partial [Gammaproteobacteria bacterium]|nr:hypothetical protein [Gammaproteobacteria bacterium]